MIRRTNVFRIRPTMEQERRLLTLADACAKMWNEINYRRRQSFFAGKVDWSTAGEYHRYKRLVSSATAQQVKNKNNEAWKSFLALLRRRAEGRLPSHVKKVRPPGYWKDRRTGRRIPRLLVRCDCYRLEAGFLQLPLRLRVRWSGRPRWRGKQGCLEDFYGDLSRA